MIMHVVHESETSTTTHTFCIHTCACFAVKKSDKKIRNKREPSCGSSTDLVYYIRGRMARTLLLISDVPIVLDHYVKCSSHCWIFPCFNNVSNNLGTVSAQLQKVARISGFLFSFPSVSFFTLSDENMSTDKSACLFVSLVEHKCWSHVCWMCFTPWRSTIGSRQARINSTIDRSQ